MSVTTPEAPPPYLPGPRLLDTVGHYDGPLTTADRMLEARAMATALCALHPLYRRSPGDCLLLLYRARALDIPLGTALDHVYINTGVGRAGLSAQLMATLMTRAGVTWTTKESDTSVSMRFRRGRKLVGTTRYDIAEAAHLMHRPHWQQSPRDCLWARCLARGARRFFHPIVGGIGYTPEEAFDMRPGEAGADTAVDVSAEVVELLEQALSEDATPDLIRADILTRARTAKLLGAPVGDGATLEQALLEVWRQKTALASAAAADHATAGVRAALTDPFTDLPTPEVFAAPAGAGVLPCGCPAHQVVTTGDHLPTCVATPTRV